MKRIIVIMIMSIAFCSAIAQSVIKFEKTVYDFGEFNEKNVQRCEFVFQNTGDKPLIIHQAYGSCGCMVANPPKEKIEPGQKGVIKVSYDGKGKFEGFFKKPITVRSNATNSIVRLYIQGNMAIDD